MSAPDDARCPKCGSESLGFGYGFAGAGGIGAYSFCLECDFQIDKHVDVPGKCLHEADPDMEKRPRGCLCTWEQGDSACPVHPTCEECGLPTAPLNQCECPKAEP